MHHPTEPRNESSRAANLLLLVILVAVIEWGVAQAIGAYRFNSDPLRGAMVLACTAAFIGLWMAALAARARRLARRPGRSEIPLPESADNPLPQEATQER
jgi:hypothetical protein